MRLSDYITQVRLANKAVFEGINALVAAQREWNAMDYGTTLADGTGQNEGIVKAAVGAVVFDSANAMVAVLNAGHATNMSKLL